MQIKYKQANQIEKGGNNHAISYVPFSGENLTLLVLVMLVWAYKQNKRNISPLTDWIFSYKMIIDLFWG